MRLISPMSGFVVGLSGVPDAVFSTEMVGPGVAIDPGDDDVCDVVAPADGRIGALFPHAFALEIDDGRTVLVHLGIDTVELAGDGFELHVVGGQQVRAGDPIVTWSPARVLASGRSALCPIIAVQADPGLLMSVSSVGQPVDAGAPLLDWS